MQRIEEVPRRLTPKAKEHLRDPNRPLEQLRPTWEALRTVIRTAEEDHTDNEGHIADPDAVFEQIREGLVGQVLEVKNRGNPNYSFVMPDDIPDSKLYVIGEVQKEQVEQDERMVPTGIRRPHHRGGILRFGRRPRLERSRDEAHRYPVEDGARYVLYKLKPTHKDDNDIWVHDELQEIMICDQRELKEFIENNNAGFADRRDNRAEIPRTEHLPESGHPVRRIHLDVNNSGPDVFGSMTEQLEAEDIRNWTGLKWKSHWKIPAPTGKKPHLMRTVSRNVEIVRDTLVKETGDKKDENGDSRDFRPTRAFVMRESDEHGNIISNKVVYVDEHFAGDFKHFRQKSGWFTDMHIDKQEKPAPRVANDLGDRLAEAKDALEIIDREDRMATWMLSYVDIVRGNDIHAEEEKLARLAEVVETAEGRRRIATLKVMISHHGPVALYKMAKSLRDDFLASASELGLSTDISDTTGTIKTPGNSISWAVESLADQYYYNFHRSQAGEEREDLEFGHTFHSHNIRAKLRQRDIVDQRVGSALMDAVMHWDEKPDVEGIDSKTHQPAYKMKRELLFNPGPLEKTPKITRKQVKQVEEKIFHDTKYDRTVRLADLVSLGRLLRKGIGR